MYIKDLLRKGEIELNIYNIEESNLKVRLLLSNLLGKNKEYLLIHDMEELKKDVEEAFWNGIARLKLGEPIQYIIGKQEFYGLDFFVNKNVLIPQPDTEILVVETLENIKQYFYSKNIKILDLCTGSGAIAISIKKNVDKYCGQTNEIWASDISHEALSIAEINSEKNNVEINFIESDLFNNINERFDVIVSNPPYIETNVIHNLPVEVQNEPKLDLDGGEDGLEFYRTIAKEAPNFLNSEGIVLVEIGYNQKDEVIRIFEENNYKEIYSKKDYSGNDRIVVARF